MVSGRPQAERVSGGAGVDTAALVDGEIGVVRGTQSTCAGFERRSVRGGEVVGGQVHVYLLGAVRARPGNVSRRPLDHDCGKPVDGQEVMVPVFVIEPPSNRCQKALSESTSAASMIMAARSMVMSDHRDDSAVDAELRSG